MMNEGIISFQRNCKKLILAQSLDENQIKELTQNQKYHSQIQIMFMNLDNVKTLVFGFELRKLTNLIGLDIIYTGKDVQTQNSIIDFAQCLQYLTNLKYLSIKFVDFQTEMTQIGIELGKSLSFLQKLKQFSLDIINPHTLGKLGAIEIKNGLNKLIYIESLTLTFRFSNFFNNKSTLKGFFTGWNNLVTLKSLQLNIQDKSNICDEGLKLISENLKLLQNLKQLSFYLQSNSYITNVGLEYFKESIKFFKSLQKIECDIQMLYENRAVFDLLDCLFEQENIESIYFKMSVYEDKVESYTIGKSIKPNSKLKCFVMNIININPELDSNLLILDKNFQYLKQLVQLNIFVEEYQISYEINDIQNIESQYCLKELCIRTFNQINFQLVLNQGFCIQNFKDLKKLDLKLTFDIVDNIKEISAFSKSIQQLQQLESLLLYLKSCNLTYEYQKQIFYSLKSLQSLKELDIWVNSQDSNEIDDLLLLGESLIFLKQLKSLTLYISYKIQDQNSNQLSCAFQSLQNLEQLSIYIISEDNNDFKEHEGNLLFSTFQHLNNLNQIAFSLYMDVNETSKIYQSLANSLIKLKKLKIICSYNLEFQVIYEKYLKRIIERKLLRLVMI